MPAKLLAVSGKTHAFINADLGLPDDEATSAMLGFVDEVAGGAGKGKE